MIDSCGLGNPGRPDLTRGRGDRVPARSRQMGSDVAKEAEVNAKSSKRLVREGDLAAEVDVTLVEAEGGWTPYLSLEDAYRLDDVRDALRAGDTERASRLANRVYRLTPVQV